MSVGDTVSALSATLAGARLSYQPAVGVEALITGFYTDKFLGAAAVMRRDISVDLTNGVIFIDIANNSSRFSNITKRVLVSNTFYLSIQNTSGVLAILGFTGVETK